jgi:hypothetical protein
MPETPGRAFPTISDGATVKIKLGALLGFIGVVIGGSVWLTTIYNKVDRQGQDIQDIKSDLKEIKNRMGSIGMLP